MSAALSFENISVTYGEGTPFCRHALKNINCEFGKGEIIGIIGHTGSGKSTLAMLTNGLLKPTEGTIRLYGEDIWADPKKMHRLRGRVGLVFQYPEYQLFEATVHDDIAFGPKNMGFEGEALEARISSAAFFCGIGDDIMQRSPFELSGGQKRRVAIAGIMAMRPEVLVLDEPAAGLDPEGREQIFGGLCEYRDKTGATLVLISHSMEDIARYCDRILVLKDGEVYMYGTVGEIFAEADRLFDASLDLPQVTKLFIELRKRHVVQNIDVYTLKYAKNELMPLLLDKGEEL